MLSETIKALRTSKGLSQEELAIKLNVVRQTISKWEQGLSVPDAAMLISLADALGTTVGGLLGESAAEAETDDVRVIAEKLEIINLQLARRADARRKALRWSLILACVTIGAIFTVLMVLGSPYLGWDFNDPETAVAGTLLHAFEWLFVRLAPIALLGMVVGIVLTHRKA